MRHRARRLAFWTAMATLAGVLAPGSEARAVEAGAEEESCISCHRDPDFLVTHPKLYEYYRDWERSIHAEADVTCSDCHGGQPDEPTVQAAHRGMARESSAESPVHFSNVPATCGSCHGDVEEAYRGSAHYRELVGEEAKKGEAPERHGPSCVTCHRSMNTLTLDVTSVEAACSRCHDRDNHPEIPERARRTLNKFLSIDRFHRYVAVRLDPSESREFLEAIDRRREALSVLWHSFDLDRIDAATVSILDDLRQKRDEIRQRAHAADAGAGAQTAP